MTKIHYAGRGKKYQNPIGENMRLCFGDKQNIWAIKVLVLNKRRETW